jgi:galactose mutarotase-like enzyme
VTSVKISTFSMVPGLTLGAGDLEATFLPDVGMVGVSLRHRGEELLALPDGLRGYRAGHVAGLPFLAPWANRLGGRRYEVDGNEVNLEGMALHTDPQGLPIHGTMTAQSGWELLAVVAEEDVATLEAWFDFGARPDLLKSFPFPHELRLRFAIEPDGLSVATTVTATGDRAVPVAFGWHPYLRLPGAKRRSWVLTLPDRAHLALDERGLPDGSAREEPAESQPIADRTLDDLYALAGPEQLALEGGGRRLRVVYEAGYPYAQVFCPAGQEYVCLEPMTAPTNALLTGGYRQVEPGQSSTARFTIKVTAAPS